MDRSTTRLVRAPLAYLNPPEPPVEDAAVVFHEGRVKESGPFSLVSRGFHGPVEEVDGILAPGLINAHCHLELCHLAGKTVQGRGFAAWVRSLVAAPMGKCDPGASARGAEQMRNTGTRAVGDIATRHAETMARLFKDAGLFFVQFNEAIGRKQGPASRLGPVDGGVMSMAGHALYSTSPLILRGVKEETRDAGLPFSLHLAEHEDEIEVLTTGAGTFADMLAMAGLRDRGEPPSGKRPARLALDLGLVDASTLLVHCVHLDHGEIAGIAETGASVCLCPRSNEYIGVGRAPWEELFDSGLNLCLGTDSLASNHDLDLWNEMKMLADGWSGGVHPWALLAMATSNPARALGLGSDYGTLLPGARGEWCRVPEELAVFFDNHG